MWTWLLILEELQAGKSCCFFPVMFSEQRCKRSIVQVSSSVPTLCWKQELLNCCNFLKCVLSFGVWTDISVKQLNLYCRPLTGSVCSLNMRAQCHLKAVHARVSHDIKCVIVGGRQWHTYTAPSHTPRPHYNPLLPPQMVKSGENDIEGEIFNLPYMFFKT